MTETEARERVHAWFGDGATVDVTPSTYGPGLDVHVQLNSRGSWSGLGREGASEHDQKAELDGLCESLIGNVLYPSAYCFHKPIDCDQSGRARLLRIQAHIKELLEHMFK